LGFGAEVIAATFGDTPGVIVKDAETMSRKPGKSK
jgi:hypothetical protein